MHRETERDASSIKLDYFPYPLLKVFPRSLKFFFPKDEMQNFIFVRNQLRTICEQNESFWTPLLDQDILIDTIEIDNSNYDGNYDNSNSRQLLHFAV